ncbi:MAG: Ig-like domain-containing protein [Gemmatimonadetes bacterium]|nr:Ig-like domain-containing protein [Gemmatimonadota bacterium]
MTMHFSTRPALCLAVLLLLGGAAACRDNGTNPDDRRVTLEIRRNAVSSEEETIAVGATLQLSTHVEKATGTAVTPQPVAKWSSDAPSVASVDSAGLVTGLQVGSARIVATTGGTSDTVRINVATPVPSAISCANAANPIRLSVGQIFTTTADQAVTLCVASDVLSEYALIPFNASDATGARLNASFTALDARLAFGPPSPARVPQIASPDLPARDVVFHERLRERSARYLEPRLRVGLELRPSAPALAAVPKVGDLLALNASIRGTGCDSTNARSGRVVAITSKAIIVADTANPRTPNPGDVLTDEDYRFFGEAFDTLVWRVNTQNFGEPTDIDKNSRVIIFFTRAVNELTSGTSDSYVAGFFYNRDLFPRSGKNACAGSNVGEMFYMMVPDPAGTINGNRRSRTFVRNASVGVIAHEFQHLINDSRRLYVSKAPVWEETWLNEGLSHIAEELTFFAAAGVGPGQNLGADIFRDQRTTDAYNRYNSDNVRRLISFLEAPERASLLGDDDLSTRGSVWSFLRYAADRMPGNDAGIWTALVNSRTQGLANLAAVLAVNPRDWMRDWHVSIYADDAGFQVDPQYQQPSWNFRSLIPGIRGSLGTPLYGRYPLNTVQLAGARQQRSLQGGGGAYYRFGSEAGRTVALRTTVGGLPAPSRLRLALVRTK